MKKGGKKQEKEKEEGRVTYKEAEEGKGRGQGG